MLSAELVVLELLPLYGLAARNGRLKRYGGGGSKGIDWSPASGVGIWGMWIRSRNLLCRKQQFVP